MINRHAFTYNDSIAQQYGPVVKFHAPLGVSTFSESCDAYEMLTLSVGKRPLCVRSKSVEQHYREGPDDL